MSFAILCDGCGERVEVLGLGVGSAEDCDVAMHEHAKECPVGGPLLFA